MSKFNQKSTFFDNKKEAWGALSEIGISGHVQVNLGLFTATKKRPNLRCGVVLKDVAKAPLDSINAFLKISLFLSKNEYFCSSYDQNCTTGALLRKKALRGGFQLLKYLKVFWKGVPTSSDAFES